MAKRRKPSHQIGDGYTTQFYIQAEQLLYPALRGEYRPMIPDEVNTMEDKTYKLRRADKATAADLVVRDAIRTHILSWDAAYPDDHHEPAVAGQAIPITLKTIKNLPPRLFKRLLDLVIGSDGGDPDPLASAEEEDDYVKRLQQEDGADVKN